MRGDHNPAGLTRIAMAAMAMLAMQAGHAQGTISTVAGTTTCCSSTDGGPATSAWLPAIHGVAVDPSGNLYIADQSSAVRKVAPNGGISTFAGTNSSGYFGDGGPAAEAALVGPWGLAADSSGNIYVVDNQNHRVRKIDTSGIITTVAGNGTPGYAGDNGPATQASLNFPTRVAVDQAGNLYIADHFNSRIRKVDTSGNISTVAGNGNSIAAIQTNVGDGGPAASAPIGAVVSVAVDNFGNLFLSDGARLRMVNTVGVISTIAGNGVLGYSGDGGPAVKAQIYGASDLATDNAGNVYIADNQNFRIRKVDMSSGIITTVAGNGTYGYTGDGGPSTSAELKSPNGVTLDAPGNLYIADESGVVRKVAAPPPPAPAISANGVTNGASFVPPIVPGSWATIQGTGLAGVTDTWANAIVNGNLPTTLDGVKVTVGGQSAYLYYISPGQINFMVPNIAPGAVQVTVTNAGGTSAAVTVTSATYGPAFFPWPGGQAVATRQDYSYAGKAGTFAGATTVAAKPGDVIILWGTGFGPTTPTAPVGVQVPPSQAYSTSSLPTVTINGVAATVYGAALAPGFAGLYQVAIQVPASLANGDWPLVATIGGVSSPGGVILSVQN